MKTMYLPSEQGANMPDTLTESITREDVTTSLMAMLKMADVLHRCERWDAAAGNTNGTRQLADDLGFLTWAELVQWCYRCIDEDRRALRRLMADLPASPSLDERAEVAA